MSTAWLDEQMRERLIPLFRLHGVSGNVLVALTPGGDEAIFVVTPQDAATKDEPALVAALMEALRRKVSVLTQGSPWGDALVPLMHE